MVLPQKIDCKNILYFRKKDFKNNNSNSRSKDNKKLNTSTHKREHQRFT